MVFVPGELTKRSPFGAYVIMRGDGSSAYVLTVNPAGTDGNTPSGFGAGRLGFGLAVPGAGSVLATGCGTTVFCCALTTAITTAQTGSADSTANDRDRVGTGCIEDSR